MFRRFAALVLMPVMALAVYVGAGFGLGMVPVGPMAPASAAAGRAGDSVELLLVANPFHADLIFPVDGAGTDWAGFLADSALPGATHVAIGWGDRAFYLETPTLADITLGTAARAVLSLGPAVLHVSWYVRPMAGGDTRRLTVSADQARRLAAYVRSSFALDAAGRPQIGPDARYAANDAFYEATGRWSPLVTCNEWLARGLRASGIRTGFWAPFANGVMRYLPEE
jgi:uncharacterized protein (TIGR02117 family)